MLYPLLTWFSICYRLNLFLLYFQCLNLDTDCLNERIVEFVDIAYDEVNANHYKEEEVRL
jgi:hypothetical protein